MLLIQKHGTLRRVALKYGRVILHIGRISKRFVGDIFRPGRELGEIHQVTQLVLRAQMGPPVQ